MGGANVGAEALTQLDAMVDDIVTGYEDAGPAVLAPGVVRQRRWVEQLLRGHQHPRQRAQLYLVAGKLSGLLGYMAVNLGRFPLARAYCAEAFQLEELLGEQDLQAWVRGTQSLGAYYAGDYQAAADLAGDGQRYARGGPQSVRLAVNGEARALARLGDARGTDEAVNRAYQVMGRYEPVGGVSPCISFGMYSAARTASNAATAYVSLRQPDKVREHADQAAPVFDRSPSVWSRSLLRLDIATALVVADDPDPEQGGLLVQEALALSAERPITSVLQRSREFVAAADRWHDLPAVAEVTEAVCQAARR